MKEVKEEGRVGEVKEGMKRGREEENKWRYTTSSDTVPKAADYLTKSPVHT